MDDGEISRKDITLKELDHIQAIIGRFDTLFFLMKQVCLATMAAVFVAPTSPKLNFVLYHSWMIPILFLIFEISFRFFYWLRYVMRKEEIAKYINVGNLSKLPTLYEITKPAHSIFDWKMWRRSVKIYDLLFYFVLWIIALRATQELR